ncbi:hypothetical protein AA313_de0202877 [Arthrobotrys entomopaga]|nr:hypothetical protein AA313_de0202877 [Arthrobotrys entomopaga]
MASMKPKPSRPFLIPPPEDTRAEKLGRMPEIISTTPKPIVYCVPEHYALFTCPDRKCGEKFDSDKDRHDHAHWHHAWCSHCCTGFDNLRALEKSCVPGCDEKYRANWHLLGCIEDLECGTLGDEINEIVTKHWLEHLILLDYTRDFTLEETIEFSVFKCKVVVMEKSNPWINDPLGKYFENLNASKTTLKVVESGIGTGILKDKLVIEEKFICLVCGKKFGLRQWEEFIEHLRSYKDYRTYNADKEGRDDDGHVIWKCESCDCGYHELSSLAVHYDVGCKDLVNHRKEMMAKATSQSLGLTE